MSVSFSFGLRSILLFQKKNVFLKPGKELAHFSFYSNTAQRSFYFLYIYSAFFHFMREKDPSVDNLSPAYNAFHAALLVILYFK